MNVDKIVKDVVESNNSLLEQVLSIEEGSKDYDATVYKLLRVSLSITDRLDKLYRTNEQKVKLGQLLVANDVFAKLFTAHTQTDNYDF